MAPQVHLLSVVPGSGLLFGLMLAAAIGGGYAARALRVPRVVGYLLAGAGLKLLLQWLLIGPDDDTAARLATIEELNAAAAPLKPVKDLALGIILFSIGGVFESRHLKAVGKKVFKIALGESGLTFVLVLMGTAVAGMMVGGDTPAHVIICFALLLAFASVATAPAATLSVLREYDAKGPATDTILSLTGVNNVVCLVTFQVCFLLLAAAGALGEVRLSPGGVWLNLATTTLGSLLLGTLLGFALSVVHARLQIAETVLILVATLIILGAGEGWLLEHHDVSYNFLLTALCLGATFANIAIDPDRLEDSLRKIAQPVLVGFFAIAGYQLHLADLFELRWVGGAYVVCRLVGKAAGTWLGMRWSKATGELNPLLGTALLCQAAVVIGLADFVDSYWENDWAERFATVVLGSVVIFEVCGPLLIKWVVVRSGEVKAVTLLHRPGSTAAGSASILALTWTALLRALGLGQKMTAAGQESLKVRHIMRTKVKCIPATADLDEVLHLVEQSRHNHFPVIDEEDGLVGVIHFSDIREIIYDPFLSRLMTAVDLSNPNTRAVSADMSLEEVLRAFQEGDVGSLPVVESSESRNVVGIIEQRDLLRALHLSRVRR
jgi:CBS domain-containing protein